jgi:hypothetical protein
METYYGEGHIPGAPKPGRIELNIDWANKEVEVHLPEAQGGVTEWPGLLLQTFGRDEAVFRTKGIPKLSTHWWHTVRYSDDHIFVMVLGLPNSEGIWPTCSFSLKRL